MEIALNADMGESFGRYVLGNDAAIVPHVSSANIACGMHAGDPVIMAETVRLARAAGLCIGAHPGFPDLNGFGRRLIGMSAREIEYLVTYQIGALQAIAHGFDAQIEYVKPHGALNNMAHENREVADAIARGIRAAGRDLIFVANCRSQMVAAAQGHGLCVAHEAYADRRYNSDGTLVSRSRPGSVIRDPAEVAKRVVTMLEKGGLLIEDGTVIPTPIDTFCIHADEPEADGIARTLHAELVKAGFTIITMTRAPVST